MLRESRSVRSLRPTFALRALSFTCETHALKTFTGFLPALANRLTGRSVVPTIPATGRHHGGPQSHQDGALFRGLCGGRDVPPPLGTHPHRGGVFAVYHLD